MSVFRHYSWKGISCALLVSALAFSLVSTGLKAATGAGREAASQSELNGTSAFWVHNFQFFAGDYRIGATLQRSSDHGDFYVENAVVLSLAEDASNRLVYAGTAHGGVFRRGFDDSTWTRISDGLPGDSDRGGNEAVNALVVTGSGVVIAGTDQGIYSYDPVGEVWGAKGGSAAVWDMQVDGSTLYAAMGGYVWRDDEDGDGDIDVSMGVRRSIDGGANWDDYSAGLPKDEDGEYIEVYSLAKTNTAIYAATPGGVFMLPDGADAWTGAMRDLDVATPQVAVKLSESTRDEAQMGGAFFRDYYRWLTVGTGSVFSEIELTLTSFGVTAGDVDTISIWRTPLEDGILGDAGALLLELSSITGSYNVSFSFIGYDSLLTLSSFRFLDEDSVATIINPWNEALLLVSDAQDPAYEPGGQFATITYDNGVNSTTWSARIEALKEPNKDLRGVTLTEANRIAGVKPNYYRLNDPAELANFSASTIDKANTFTMIIGSAAGDSLVGFSGNVNVLMWDGSQLYAGTSAGVAAYDDTARTWSAMPYLLPFTPIPVHSLATVDGDLVAGGDFGFYQFSAGDSRWLPTNKGLMSYITDNEIDELADYLDNSTPVDPTRGIYEILTDAENFGVDRLPDIDQSDKIGFLLHDIHDIAESWNGTSNGSAGGIEQIYGYIRPLDQALIGRTNRRDMIYLTTKGADAEERGAAIAHQLVSLMMLKQDVDEERWISEGIAFFGEKLCGFDMPATWVDFPQRAAVGLPLVVGTPNVAWAVSPDGGSAVGELHTKAGLWITYLYENLGGIDFVKALMDEENNGIDGIEALMRQGFRPAGVSDLDFNDLFTAWTIAYAINDTNASDPVTKLRYGYSDPLYYQMIESYRSRSTDRLGVLTMPLMSDGSMNDYDILVTPLLFEDGINSWSTVYRLFLYLEATGGRESWAGQKFHLNGVDWGTVAVWLLKHKTDGGFDVVHLTDSVTAENELIFDIFDEYGANADTSEYAYDKIIIGFSNQHREPRGIRVVLATDVTPPEIELSLVHNVVYPEFVSFYIWTNERLHEDVGVPENPVVNIIRGAGRDETVGVSLFHTIMDGSNYLGSIYSGELQLESGESFILKLTTIQDIAGNDAPPESLTVSVGKVIAKSKQVFQSENGRVTLTLPADALGDIPYVTISQASPRVTSLSGSANFESLSSAISLYTIGPGGAQIRGRGIIRIKVDPEDADEQQLGLYRVFQGGLEPVPSSYDPGNGSISAQIDVLGTYMIAGDAAIPAEIATVPERYELVQNYPNPFNPATTISFGLPEAGYTRVEVFDILGRTVRTLVDGYYEAGTYDVIWNGKESQGAAVGSGVYFYSIHSKGFTATRKMILLK